MTRFRKGNRTVSQERLTRFIAARLNPPVAPLNLWAMPLTNCLRRVPRTPFLPPTPQEKNRTSPADP